MPLLQLVLTSIFYLLLCAIVYLLSRHATGAGAQLRQTTTLLAESNAKLAESNAKSAEAAHEAAEAALKLAELLGKKHAS